MIKNFLRQTSAINAVFWKYVNEQKKLRKLKKQSRRRKKAIRIANLRHKSDGRRYYVLPDYHGRLTVLNKTEIEALKKAGILHRKVNVFHLIQESIYFTP